MYESQWDSEIRINSGNSRVGVRPCYLIDSSLFGGYIHYMFLNQVDPCGELLFGSVLIFEIAIYIHIFLFFVYYYYFC